MSTPTQDPEQVEAPEKKSTLASFRPVLKNRNFLLLWVAQLISQIVLNAANFGIILLVDQITNNNVIWAGVAIIAFTLPAVPFSALAGVLIDRQNKRRVLWVSNILRFATMFLVVISLLADRTNLWPLFTLSFLTSIIGQFFSPAEGASIPLLVGERELLPALSLFNISLSVAQAIGFLLLGRIIATIFPPFTLSLGLLHLHFQSIDMLFVIAGVAYVICSVLILAIPVSAFNEAHLFKQHKDEPSAPVSQSIDALWHDLISGWRIVRADQLLFFAVIMVSMGNILMLLIGQVAGAFVQNFLNRQSTDMSLVLAPAAFGLVGASILMPRLAQKVGKIRLTLIGILALSVGFFLFPVSHWIALTIDPRHGTSSPWFLWVTVLLVFGLGVAISCVNVPAQTIMQEHAPERSRARVLSLQFMLYNAGSIPILLFAGAISLIVNFSQLMIVIGISMLLLFWWGIRYTIQAGKQEGVSAETAH
jgi:MFS family permease